MKGFLEGDSVFLEPAQPDLAAEDIENMFSPPGFFTLRLDGAALKDKKSLLSELSSGLRFPAYFGGNWDALLDCLRSLPDLIDAPGYALIVGNSPAMLSGSPEDLRTFREIASEAGKFLAEHYGRPLRIVML